MGYTKPSKELLELIKELKYARTGEDKLAAMVFASRKTMKEYRRLTYTQTQELEKRV